MNKEKLCLFFEIIFIIILVISAFLFGCSRSNCFFRNNELEKIVRYEINNADLNGDCVDFAAYYNKTFSKYPDLDIRWPRSVDLCNNLTYCDIYHTYIVVNGYGSECIVDQHQYACVNVIDIK